MKFDTLINKLLCEVPEDDWNHKARQYVARLRRAWDDKDCFREPWWDHLRFQLASIVFCSYDNPREGDKKWQEFMNKVDKWWKLC